MKETIKVLLVEDHDLVRAGLVSMIMATSEVRVSGEAGSGLEAVDKFQFNEPDVVLMDIMLPDISGFEAAQKILRLNPAAKILFLSMEINEEFIQQAIQVGGKGYILKESNKNELFSAIKTVYTGETYFSSKVKDIVFKSFVSHTHEAPADPISTLTERELEILKLLAEGVKKSAIADKLFISEKTIDSHRLNLMKKLNLENNTELIKFAIRHDLID